MKWESPCIHPQRDVAAYGLRGVMRYAGFCAPSSSHPTTTVRTEGHLLVGSRHKHDIESMKLRLQRACSFSPDPNRSEVFSSENIHDAVAPRTASGSQQGIYPRDAIKTHPNELRINSNDIMTSGGVDMPRWLDAHVSIFVASAGRQRQGPEHLLEINRNIDAGTAEAQKTASQEGPSWLEQKAGKTGN